MSAVASLRICLHVSRKGGMVWENGCLEYLGNLENTTLVERPMKV